MNLGLYGWSNPERKRGNGGFDYARGKTPTSDVGYTNIANITDGNDSTEGDSASAASSQYVQIDLGNRIFIATTRVIYGSTGNRSVAGSLQYSQDGLSWQIALTWSNNASLDVSYLVGIAARYWRHQSNVPGNSGFGINIKTWSLSG